MVFFAGFGALFVFHLVGQPHPPELPGLFSFRAATLGDGILLPVLAFSVVSAAGGFRDVPTAHRRLAAGVSLLVTGIAVWTQVGWLRNPHPVVNWTLPEPHTFTAAGWYHAFFFVAFSSFLAFFTVIAWLRLRVAGRPCPEVALFGLSASSFVGLWLLDGGRAATPSVALAFCTLAVYAAMVTAAKK